MVKKIGLFDIAINVSFSLLIVIMIYPFWHTLMGSFMTLGEYFRKDLLLIVQNPTLQNYRMIFEDGKIWRPMINTCFITVVGSISALSFTSFISYGLSKKFAGAFFIMQFIVLTMIIDAGLIPRYIMYKNMGLINNYMVYFLPALAMPFNVIIMRTYFRSQSKELEDASKIDGCNEFGHFFRIALPLSKPMLATIGLFLTVGFWNTFFVSMFFISDDTKKTLQDYLYRIVTDEESEFFTDDVYFTQTVKLANIIITTLPILLVYPFLQKYFVKGLMIGAIKG